jgi:hypothetical protein
MHTIISSRNTYSPSEYDNYFCLKPPILLWGALLFLSRSITLPLIVALGNFAGVNSEALSVLRRLWSVEALAPSLLAAVVLYTLIRRVPSAPPLVRWIWAHGHLVLALSAGIDLILSSIAAIRIGNFEGDALLSLSSAAFDGYFLLYLMLARRVRDTFLEFPPPNDAPTV